MESVSMPSSDDSWVDSDSLSSDFNEESSDSSEDPQDLVVDTSDDQSVDASAWRMFTNEYPLSVGEDPVEIFLLKVITEETKHIAHVVDQYTNGATRNDITNMLVGPMVPVLVEAVNSTTLVEREKITDVEAVEFIKVLMLLSFYRVSPTGFFENSAAYPISRTLGRSKFKKVLAGLNRSRTTAATDNANRWDAPFKEDPVIRLAESTAATTNKRFFLPDITILSTDDDQYRLRSSKCEEIGLPRVKIPNKAFGPVSTGCVSLATGITLISRLSAKGDSDLATIKIIFRNLFNKELPEQVKGNNLVALDRGYLSKQMIDYISSTGCNIIGTHKRVTTFPFTFGQENASQDSRTVIAEKGAKMVYWAKQKPGGEHNKVYKALAYRSGRGHVATIFTTLPDVDPGRFVYVRKKKAVIPAIPALIRRHMTRTVQELTFGQGGFEWHLLRAGLGIITSTVASLFLQKSLSEMEDEDEELFALCTGQLGMAPTLTEETVGDLNPENLAQLNLKELKAVCRSMGHRTSGRKDDLVERILTEPRAPRLDKQDKEEILRSEMMSLWFQKPLKTSTSLKIGRVVEDIAAKKLPAFLSACGLVLTDVTEVGLVRSTNVPFLATSVDRLGVLMISDPDDNDEDAYAHVVTIEIKTATNQKTQDEARARICPFDTPIVRCKFGSETFHQLVWTVMYRNQTVHHAATFDLPIGVFVVSSTSSIIYTVLVDYSEEIRRVYRLGLYRLGNKYISWYTGDEEWDPRMVLRKVKLFHAVDIPTVVFWKQLSEKVLKMNSDERTRLPPAHDIVPHAVALWNKCKGGQDVVSRMLKNVKVDFRSLKPRAYIIIRLIMVQLLNSHLIYRITKTTKDGNDEPTSFYAFKRLLNREEAFCDSLWDTFNEWAFNGPSDEDKSVDCHVDEQQPVCIPKRNRLKFYNNAGRNIRLTVRSAMDHQGRSEKPKRCLLCTGYTTVSCPTCEVHLCKVAFGANTKSCFEKFHINYKIKLDERNGRRARNLQQQRVLQEQRRLPEQQAHSTSDEDYVYESEQSTSDEEYLYDSEQSNTDDSVNPDDAMVESPNDNEQSNGDEVEQIIANQSTPDASLPTEQEFNSVTDNNTECARNNNRNAEGNRTGHDVDVASVQPRRLHAPGSRRPKRARDAEARSVRQDKRSRRS